MNPDKRGNFTVTRRKTSGAPHPGNSRNGVTSSRGGLDSLCTNAHRSTTKPASRLPKIIIIGFLSR